MSPASARVVPGGLVVTSPGRSAPLMCPSRYSAENQNTPGRGPGPAMCSSTGGATTIEDDPSAGGGGGAVGGAVGAPEGGWARAGPTSTIPRTTIIRIVMVQSPSTSTC